MKYGIYHKDCEDGTVSAIVLRKAIKGIHVFPTSRAWEWKELPLKKTDEVIFADICPDPEDMLLLEKKGIRYLVIDHHITAHQQIEAYKRKYNVFFNFFYYPNHCGATAAWQHFFKKKKLPLFLKYIQIADLWQWKKDKNARYVTEYIRTVCRRGSLDDYEKMFRMFNYKTAVEKGKILHKKLMNDVVFLVKKAAVLRFKNKTVLAVNAQHAISELGHALAEKSHSGIGVVYELRPEHNLVKFHVRGAKGNAARKLAEQFNGGGHDQAAGFTLTLKQFFELLRRNERRRHSR